MARQWPAEARKTRANQMDAVELAADLGFNQVELVEIGS
jgi:hypothetical protein